MAYALYLGVVVDSEESEKRLFADFLAESEELLEELSRDLLILDQEVVSGGVDPDRINSVFRSMHTLKGIAGIFGHEGLSTLSHALENLLDDFRMGRKAADRDALDILFEGVGILHAQIKSIDGKVAYDESSVRGILDKLAYATPAPTELPEVEIDESILSVLTEYEESRLKSAVKDKKKLYWVTVQLQLDQIDSVLTDIKKKLKRKSEIITYIPNLAEQESERLLVDVLVASSLRVDELQTALGDGYARVSPVSRSTTVSKTLVPPKTSKENKQTLRTSSSHEIVQRTQSFFLSSAKATVRVDIDKLDYLMGLLGEISIAKSAIAPLIESLGATGGKRNTITELSRIHRDLERFINELQLGVLAVRMVPVGHLFEKLARGVRQTARERHKEVKLVVTGSETEIDKLIVEELFDPLLHLTRNAVDHGIESKEHRSSSGKPETGTLVINAFQKGRHVVIEVQDDGAGLDLQKLRHKAITLGLCSIDDVLTDQDIANLVFLAGLSTADSVTELSGRGVGLDVVRNRIVKLGGVVDVSSEPGVGTKFVVTLPVTLAMVHALMFRVAEQDVAIPLDVVQEAMRIHPEDIQTLGGKKVVDLRNQTLALFDLRDLFGQPTQMSGRRFVVVASLGNRRIGVVVDELVGQRDIVVKPLPPSLASTRGVAGATDLGDQRIALVIDVASLLDGTKKKSAKKDLEAM